MARRLMDYTFIATDPPQQPPMAVGNDMDNNYISRMTAIADKVKAELVKDRVRLQGQTGIIINNKLRGYIMQWKIIDEDALDEIKAKQSNADAVEMLIGCLQRCRRGSVVLFARALVKLNMAHQLKTIDKEDKDFLKEGKDKDIWERLKDLD